MPISFPRFLFINYNYTIKEPQNPMLIIKAPTLRYRASGLWDLGLRFAGSGEDWDCRLQGRSFEAYKVFRFRAETLNS